uniref:Uncharacterized protein n=1 Tax=Myotis myotis TaxID=51298 RepID=A0A7J7QXW7_MYOMY|nr:hypothetical protein mMyoMyo1_011273 [Myotis myotis]
MLYALSQTSRAKKVLVTPESAALMVRLQVPRTCAERQDFELSVVLFPAEVEQEDTCPDFRCQAEQCPEDRQEGVAQPRAQALGPQNGFESQGWCLGEGGSASDNVFICKINKIELTSLSWF